MATIMASTNTDAERTPPPTPELAWSKIDQHLHRLPGRERLPSQEAAGTLLASAVLATVDLPQADVSAMDGYACAGEPPLGQALLVRGTAAAGPPPTFELESGQCARIMTGAVLPKGADRVIQVEHSDGGRERVVFHRGGEPGKHIRRHGEVVRRGQDLLGEGTLLSPASLALLAAHGVMEVEVQRRPRVAVLSTGDEVVPAHETPGPGQLRDSNSPFLLAALREIGLAGQSLGIAPDQEDELERRIRKGMESDLLLLCGGVSMGEFDLVEGVLARLGCETVFDRVAIQPGKPLVAARHADGWVLGLPGNPASVMATFWLFARPLLRRLQGLPDGFWHGALTAVLDDQLPGGKGRDRFLPASVEIRNGTLRAQPHLPRGSHDLVAQTRGLGLIRIPAQGAPRAAGEACEVLMT